MTDALQRSHEDIYRRQQATDLNIARIDGKIDNILQMLTMRAQQATNERLASEKLINELRNEHAEQSKAIWEKFTRTDLALERIREVSDQKIDAHKEANSAEVNKLLDKVGKLDGKLLAVGGGISLLSFILVIFAPIIQHQFLRSVPANGEPAHYELRK